MLMHCGTAKVWCTSGTGRWRLVFHLMMCDEAVRVERLRLSWSQTCDTATTGAVCSQVCEPQTATCTYNTVVHILWFSPYLRSTICTYHGFHHIHALPYMGPTGGELQVLLSVASSVGMVYYLGTYL